MKYLKVLVFILSIVAIGAAIYYSTANRATRTLKETMLPSNQNILQTQINSQDPITVKVTPKDLSESVTAWDFEVTLDTHSNNLDQDLTKITVLIDDKGNRFNPAAWEGDPPQGHHRSGILTFQPISPLPKSIELKIEQTGDLSEKSFKWELR